jgi:hypothetical protein
VITLGTTPYAGTLTFTVSLAGPTGSATLGAVATASVSITGSAVPGTLAFAGSTAFINQATGLVTLAVNRSGGSTGAVSVLYTTVNGTAQSDIDYATASGTLSWADGDSTPRTIEVPLNTLSFAGTRSFSLVLSAPAGGATLGANASLLVTINGSGGGSAGVTTVVPFRALPAWPGGPGSEWVNGETRLVKDNNAAGSGEIFGFVWPDDAPSMVLLASGDNGATWRVAATQPSNSCGSPCPYHVVALTQDSTGKVHALGWVNIADSGYYLRFTLAYSGGRISGYSLDTPGGLALPDHRRAGIELRADIKMVTDASGAETVAYAINMSTFKCPYDCDIKVYMARATSLSPGSGTQFVNLSGGAGDTLVFDSCAVSACATYGFSSHVHTALFAQNAASHDLYLFQGPIDADYGLAYNDPSFNSLYVRRLASTAAGWSLDWLTTIPTATQANVTAELMSVASGTHYAWLMYVDPAKGVRFGRIDAAGAYSEGATNSPDPAVNRNGWGVFSVSADDTKIWAIWDTLAPIAGGNAKAGEGYWDGSTWTLSADTGASDAMGMAGIAGWKNGAAGLLFSGSVGPQTYVQPSVATVQTQ